MAKSEENNNKGKEKEKGKGKRKKTKLRIVEETYTGEMTIEEAFQKAFEPYFK